jgi:hypothetical protein
MIGNFDFFPGAAGGNGLTCAAAAAGGAGIGIDGAAIGVELTTSVGGNGADV